MSADTTRPTMSWTPRHPNANTVYAKNSHQVWTITGWIVSVDIGPATSPGLELIGLSTNFDCFLHRLLCAFLWVSVFSSHLFPTCGAPAALPHLEQTYQELSSIQLCSILSPTLAGGFEPPSSKPQSPAHYQILCHPTDVLARICSRAGT